MTDITIPPPPPSASPSSAVRRGATGPFYFAAWRWHFYAGLYVVPFLVVLALTGLVMLWTSVLDGRDGENAFTVAAAGSPLAVSAQMQAVTTAFPQAPVVRYIAPRAAEGAAIFQIDRAGEAVMVAVDPYAGTVLGDWPRRSGWYDFASDVHGTLMLGTLGDRLIEIAAGFAVVLVVTGLYLWWPRGRHGVLRMLVPDFAARGRPLWKSLHGVVGAWMSAILVVFLLSGLSWSGVWGEKFTQAWSTFPAEKWDNVPLSDATHAAMNHGTKQVPWGLEQTPMPASGSQAGAPGIADGVPVDLQAVVDFARASGFAGRMQVNMPSGETGVWTISRDSMSNDSADPTSDRTVHLDRFTGKVLADVGYGDYAVPARAMAVGVAFHEGDLGAWNVALVTVFCLSVVFLSASGLVMWWKRRPAGVARLVAPPVPDSLPMWKGAMALMLAVSMLFPLTGLTLIAVLALDVLVIARLPGLRQAIG
ncbi:PepSY-associated TM helix domain-containing protein [Methylobrevis pamukkalensis]|uniref:PepSY-associated TM helix n=1 Tax=Methylobrevis pamukkalensis TaxID=1439726 RepID=A0A1E3H7J4_9HYPH|nr:PepSY domain-containing protein [Methylobrevis pamukkalensis]ODN72290.1 PepSY-associated TM helix [Methylobrevis pamukkalensis]